MFCKNFLALLLWCHCYQIVLDPFLYILTHSLDQTRYVDYHILSNSKSIFPQLPYVAGDIDVEVEKVALTPGHEIALRCVVSNYSDAKFQWSKVRLFPIKGPNSGPQQSPREELHQTDDQRIIINNNVIVLRSPGHSDVGDYFCKVQNRIDGVESEKKISVRARPYIRDFNLESSTFKSAVVEEGNSLNISCNVSDDYVPDSQLTITWSSSRYEEDDMNPVEPDEQEAGIRIESLSPTIKNLVIDRVTKDHRRYYKCEVKNGDTENSKIILIRVKNEYIAIWPAIGIVIEIVILIGVIFIVENRKVEPDKEAYDRKAIQM